MKFKVGDRVVANEKANAVYGITRKGWQGVVTKVCGNHEIVVTRDPSLPGARFGVHDECFDLLSTADRVQKILVTTDGRETLARLYRAEKLVKTATAKCAPCDSFDFETGAALAEDRLLGRESKDEPPKLFPLEDIKAGFLLKVKDDDDPKPYFMTVLPCSAGALACVSKKGDYWPLANFGSALRYEDTAVEAVYGCTTPRHMLDNRPNRRELLWSRSGDSE